MSGTHSIEDRGNRDVFQDRLSRLEQAVAENARQARRIDTVGTSVRNDTPHVDKPDRQSFINSCLPDEVAPQDLYDQVTAVIQSREYQTLANSARKIQYLTKHVNASSPMVSSADEPRVFDIQAVADLTVWEGSTCALAVDWKDHAEMELEVKAEPKPSGAIDLEKQSGYWLFKYVPNENDCFPFRVTLSAVAGEDTISGSFEITPLRKLPPEQTVIGLDQEAPDVPVDWKVPEVYVETATHTRQTSPGFSFNNRQPADKKPLELRRVKIIAKELTWDENDDPYGICGTYNGAKDIESLEIYAEKITVRAPLSFYQTNVTLNARELRFEGAVAQIRTTPDELTTIPEIGVAGNNGLDAGNITLNIATFYSDNPGALRFDLTGGNGQDGGAGANGASGTSLSALTARLLEKRKWFEKVVKGPKKIRDGYEVIYYVTWNRNAFGIKIKDEECGTENEWPSNGGDATPNGKPGEGGNGGVFTANIQSSCGVSFNGGQAGKVPDDPTGDWLRQGRYVGGIGFPVKSIKYRFDFWGGLTWVKELGRRESVRGASFDVVHATNPHGAAGEVRYAGHSYAWMHPSLMRRLVRQMKDDYLEGRTEQARDRLQTYSMLIEEAMDSSFWSSFTRDDQQALQTCLQEMEVIRHRMAVNLDYFGHPAGWAPLLSFEVNERLFDTEIERSAEILYYTYCISNKLATAESRYNSIKKFRSQLLLDIDSAREEYGTTLERFNQLRVSAANLSTRIVQTQQDLRVKEEELIRQAVEKSKDPTWLSVAKIGLKTTGVALSMLPVGQPATGLVGGGLTLISNIDPDKPWDSIIGATDITTTFAASKSVEAAEAIKRDLTKVPTGRGKGLDKLDKAKTCFDDMQSSCSALSDGLKDMQSYFQSQSVSNDELQSVLADLKEKSPEYRQLVEQAGMLLDEKRDFADQLCDAMQSLNRCINVINQDILAADALSLNLEDLRDGLNPAVASCVDDLQRRAFDRILEFHYYMARAYEYRLLRPYRGNLDFEQLIKDLEKVARIDCWDKLDSQTFSATYRSVFKDRLAEIASEIFNEYNNHRKELSLGFQYAVSDAELGRLNAGEAIDVDFSRYLTDEENLRMVHVGVLKRTADDRRGHIRTSPAGGDSYPLNAYLDLEFEHPGISKIRSEHYVDKFVHTTPDAPNPLVWTTRYTPATNIVDAGGPSEASASLLKSLLTGDALSNIMIYSRPGVWAKLRISRSGYPNGGADITIDELKLELKYDYFKSRRDTADKRLLVTALIPDEEMNLTARETDLVPHFSVDRQDLNGRQDGRGAILRIYPPDVQGHVTIVAQSKLGNWVFNQWTDVNGNPLPNSMNGSIRLSLTDDEVVCAQYVSREHATNETRDLVRALPNFGDIGRLSPIEAGT